MDSLRKELTLEVSNGSLILKYTPRFIETPESKYSLDNWETDTPRAPGENRINLATRTGDVIGLQLSRFFAAGASDFQIVTGDNGYGVSGAGDLFTKANEFKIIRDQGGVTGDVLYFIPYITDKIATSVQQQTDRGFTGITKFKVTAMVNGSSAAKVFRIRVDAGYGRLYLDSSVGNDATNNVSDIIKVKQRLKYFGMPVTSVPFATVNSNDINGIRHALTDYTSITVDASAPGDFPGGGSRK